MLRRRKRLRRVTSESLEQRCLLAVITVTSLADAVADDGEVTLREAVDAANRDVSVDGSAAGDGHDTILFAPGLEGTVPLSERLEVTEDLTIKGRGPRRTRLDGNQLQRFQNALRVTGNAAVDLRLEGLEISRVPGTAVLNTSQGVLELRRVRVVSNDRGVFGGETLLYRTLLSRNGTAARLGAGSRIIESEIFRNTSTGSTAGVIVLGDVEIIRSTIADNRLDSNTFSSGAGLTVANADFVRIVDSTITGNSAVGSTASSGHAGGIGLQSVKEARIVGSTIVGNTGVGVGGGIHVGPGVRVSVSSSVIADNSSDVQVTGASEFVVDHTLIGSNEGTGLAAGNPDADGNLIGTAAAPIDPMLHSLGSNGGPTRTMLPMATSPVIDAGANPDRTGSDQRRRGRQAGPAPDMGAVELADVQFAMTGTRTMVEGVAGQRTLSFSVKLATAAPTPLNVDFTTTDLTATAGADYVQTQGTLTFNSVGDVRLIQVPINGDTDVEHDESFAIDLSAAGLTLAVPKRAMGVIRNDDQGFGVTNGEALFLGDAADDVVTAEVDGVDLAFTINGAPASVPLASIDRIGFHGGGGDDQLLLPASLAIPVHANGNGGHDLLSGGAANDVLVGSSGNDTIHGHGGDDEISGDGGIDEVTGGEGDDRIDVGRGRDTVSAGPGADLVFARAGDDDVSGGTGADTLIGGGGDDVLRGEAGEDVIHAHTSHDLDPCPPSTADGDDLVDGGDDDDVLFASGESDTVHGGPGNDEITGTNGLSSARLLGEEGDDTIFSRSARDVLDGGEGDDEIRWARFNQTGGSATGGPGNDLMEAVPSTGSRIPAVVFDGGPGDDTLIGSPQNDTLIGGEGNDELRGGLNDDQLYGGPGNDLLDGGRDKDVLDGGSGDDTVLGDFGADVLIGGAGSDELDGGPGTDLLLAGTTSLDDTEVLDVFQEWARSGSIYVDRVANIRDGSGGTPRRNGNTFLAGSASASPTAFDDGDADVLVGDTGLDWFFANLSTDTVLNKLATEFQDAI